MDITVRVVSMDDVDPITRLISTNRDFLAPWEPARGEDYFTPEYQQRDIAQALLRYQDGLSLPYVILDGEELVGRINVSNIIRGPFQSGDLGYWVSEAYNGRGVCTVAVGAMIAVTFDLLRMHRLQASTLLHNHGSRRVLQRNGFQPIGTAPRYLNIAGQWQDHLLHQRINETVG